jgi:hypothetical protein
MQALSALLSRSSEWALFERYPPRTGTLYIHRITLQALALNPPLLRAHSTALLIAGLLSGCTATPDPMENQATHAFAERYTKAWCSQNAASVAAHFAENGSLRINAGEAAVGHSAITASAQAFMSAFPDMVVQMDSLVQNGEGHEYHWTLIGTNTGPGGSGKPVRISGYEEWTMNADGLIQRSLGHFDEAEYARQLE